MIDQLYFNLEDVRTVRAISVNINDFDLYAQEVQRNYAQRLLGDDLYNALISDLVAGVPQTQRFVDLLDGKTYDINGRKRIFRGIKLYSSYLWLYTYYLDSGAKVTPIGVQLFKDEEAENAQSKQEARQLRDHSISSANGLEDGIIQYLQDFPDEYPEYSLGSKEEPAEDSDFTFRTVGTARTAPKNKFY